MRKRRIILILAIVVLLFLVLIAGAFILGLIAWPGHRITGVSPWESHNSLPSSNLYIKPGCGPLHIYILNVSQADSILIVTPSNKTVLIDSGSNKLKNKSVDRLVAFLENKGISRIDSVLLTHGHEDHIGGFEEVASGFDIGQVIYNEKCWGNTTAGERYVSSFVKITPSRGIGNDNDLSLDPCLTTMAIAAYDRPDGCWRDDENQNTILLKLVYGNTSFLFTGDCGDKCEEELLRQGADLRADFLKVGHHGSSTSTGSAFLNASGAKIFAISVDENMSANERYFHPRTSTLARIFATGPQELLRTDMEGTISIVSDGSRINISSERLAGDCELYSGFMTNSATSYKVIDEMEGRCG